MSNQKWINENRAAEVYLPTINLGETGTLEFPKFFNTFEELFNWWEEATSFDRSSMAQKVDEIVFSLVPRNIIHVVDDIQKSIRDEDKYGPISQEYQQLMQFSEVMYLLKLYIAELKKTCQ